MIDSSLNSLGAKVVVATSGDENHPPENIIDGNTTTFWMSTVKCLKIEKNTSQDVSHFELVTEQELEHTEGHLQSNTISLNRSSATHLRFIITSGYDHFVSVHRVSVQH
ncbi:intraflagellar transport protein 25 homolog isoform X2 [Labrus bergylta]|uniref:intraflagellar transport protein 25 homolog isoform X2 n=1 Tax=Labrus bergylta TaxID=56723 RepID=UPI0033143AED